MSNIAYNYDGRDGRKRNHRVYFEGSYIDEDEAERRIKKKHKEERVTPNLCAQT